jgi:hypothetical protein
VDPRLSSTALALVALLAGACAEPTGDVKLVADCRTRAVQGMVSSMVRERVVRAELDARPWLDAGTRARIDMATSVIFDDVTRNELDRRTGRSECSADIAIEGMAPDNLSIVRTEGTLTYWVSPGQGDNGFLVGLGYTDLETLVATHFRRIAPPPVQRTDAGSS